MEDISSIKQFIEDKKSIIKDKNHRFDKSWYIVIDNDDNVRYSESINILTQDNLKYRLIGIEESWQNYKGYYDYDAKSFYSIYENGDIHEGFFIDGWELRFSSYHIVKGNFSFSIEKQQDLLSTLNHFWETFQTVKLCKSKTEIDCFLKLYYASQNKRKYIEENKDKDHEIEFLKKQIKNYEEFYAKLSQLLEGLK